MPDITQSATETQSSAYVPSTASSGSSGASAACRSGLRGMGLADQIQMLTPRDARRSPVQREEAAAAPPAAAAAPPAASPSERLQQAWSQGTEAFQTAVDSLPMAQLVAALPSVQDGFDWLLQKLWPSGSGWSASIEIEGEGTLAGTDGGIPFDLELSGEGTAELMLTRVGGEVELAVKLEAETAGAAKPSVKLAKIPLAGGLVGATGFKVTVDLAAVAWPTSAWSKLKAGDLKGAFGDVFRSKLSLDRNTQVEAQFEGAQKAGIGGQVGVEGLLDAKAAIGAMGGLQTTVVNPTESKEGKLAFSGSLGAYGSAELESIQPGTLQPVIDLVSYLLSADLGALGDTAAELETTLGIELVLTYANLKAKSQVPTVALKLFAKAEGALTVLGMGLDEGSAKVAITLALPDIPGFIAALKKKGAGAAPGNVGLMVPASAVEAKVEGKLAFGALTRALGSQAFEIFGASATSSLGGKADVSFELEMKFTRAELSALHESMQERFATVMDLLVDGDLLGALRAYMVALGHDLSEAGAAFMNAIKKFELTTEVGIDRNYGAESPLAGTFTGAKGQIEGSVAAVQKFDLDPGQVSAAAIEATLLAIIGG